MGSNLYDRKIASGERLYAENFDDSVEQSAIYDKIRFDCVSETLPAIVLTPQCDILYPKGDLFVTVSAIFPASALFIDLLRQRNLDEDQMAGTKSVSRSAHRQIRDQFKSYLRNKVFVFHFLPELGGRFPHSFIDFRIVKTLTGEELSKRTKIAKLESPWRESVPSRYSAYSLRIGIPEYEDGFLDVVANEISPLSVS